MHIVAEPFTTFIAHGLLGSRSLNVSHYILIETKLHALLGK